MRPAEISYVVTKSSADYRACHALLRELDQPDAPMSFPTVLARDADGTLVGFLATQPAEAAIIAGPLALRADRPRRMVAFRLIEVYEAFLQSYGIKEYLFAVAKSNERFLDSIKRILESEPIEQDGLMWFHREL